MDENRYVEDAIRVEIEVLDTVIFKKTLEEVAHRGANPRSTNRANIGISSGFFSIGYGSPAAARHMSTSFSWRNPLFSSANRSSVFTLDFFHSLFGFGRGGDTGGVDPPADPAASSRISSSRRRSSCSLMVRASFSKYSRFSLDSLGGCGGGYW
jgi:hypothetical protein